MPGGETVTARGDVLERVTEAAGRIAGQAETIADRVVPPAERSLIGRAMELPLQKKLGLARRLWRDERVGGVARGALLASAAYAVLPIKVTPRFLGPLREAEKVVGLGVLLWLLIRLAPQEALAEHLDALDRPSLWDRLRGRTDG